MYMWLLLLICITVFYLSRQRIALFILSCINQRFGLIIQQFSIQYKTGLTVYLSGVQLNRASTSNRDLNLGFVGWLLAVLFQYVAISIDHIHITTSDYSIQLDAIYVHTLIVNLMRDRQWQIQVKMGSIQYSINSHTVLTTSTPSRVLLSGNRMALDIQLGVSHVSLDALPQRQTSTNPAPVWKAVCLSVQTMCFRYDFIQTATLSLHAQEIQASWAQGKLDITTKAIQCNLQEHRLVSVDNMQYSQHTWISPHTDLLSVTWMLHAPVVSLPCHQPAFLDVLKNLPASSNTSNKQRKLPNMAVALVAYAPRLSLLQIDKRDTIAFVSTKTWIMRFSGEHAYDTHEPSLLDTLFAQEEYKWLNNTHVKRHTETTMAHKAWTYFPQQQILHKIQSTYHVSAKMIVQDLHVGDEQQATQHAFVGAKALTLTIKTQWPVENTIVIFQSDSAVQVELNMEKPHVCLWNTYQDTTLSSSLLWLQTVPRAIHYYTDIFKSSQQTRPLWLDHAVFTLDITQGTMTMWCVDKGGSTPLPSGYIDNTPKKSMDVCAVLSLKKFTCVHQPTKTRFYFEQVSLQAGGDTDKLELILWTPKSDLKMHYLENTVKLDLQVEKYGLCYSVGHHYVFLLLARTIQNLQQQQQKKNPFLLDLSVQINRGDTEIQLAQDTRLYLRMDRMGIQKKEAWCIHIGNAMILGTSPTPDNTWEQLIEIDRLVLTMPQDTMDLKAKKIMITIPYQYVLATVIHHAIGVVKAVKDLHTRLLSQKGYTFTYFGPSMRNEPVLISTLKIRTRLFSIQFDDDPFEVKLRKIFRTGLMEQQRRIAYQKAFDQRSLQPCSENIQEAQHSLLQFFSQNWRKHIDQTHQEESDFYHAYHCAESYRNPTTSTEMDHVLDGQYALFDPHQFFERFAIVIAPRPCYAPLANFSAQYVRVQFQPADFPLKQTRTFVHQVGGGVPLDFDFSILIPFHLSIKAGKTWIKIRDYPLPLLYIPSKPDEKQSWTLEGNLVLADELGNLQGSRLVSVPVWDNYVLLAVRTTTPLKFYSVVDYRILTPHLSMICWSVSSSPAIQDILRVLGSITPNQIDPSLPLRFWDKVRFMIHTQVKFEFAGDLGMIVKGTRDPYDLQRRGAGIAKIWSDRVVWYLGYQNHQQEFMQIKSMQYTLAVPDLMRGGYVPVFPDALPTKGVTETEHTFLKVILQLSHGFRMGIGLQYERLSCGQGQLLCDACQDPARHVLDRCRTQVLMPHYKVLYRSPAYVQHHYHQVDYDSFRGFRSDVAHLSFSIVKLDPQEREGDIDQDTPHHNTLHLSPCFMQHVTCWYSLFGSPVSVPIRQGKLFCFGGRKSKSFREILDTIKFKVVIDPLAIGFFCTGHETYVGVKPNSKSAGLKASIRTFSADLHQRKEKAVQGHKVKTVSNFHEIQVKIADIDLRTIMARSIREDRNRPGVGSCNTSTSWEGEFPWTDRADYVILDAVLPESQHYKIDIYPFVFSPLFYFVRQEDDEHGVKNRHYLRQTHDCIMGKRIESRQFQKEHLYRRAHELDKVIETLDQKLDIILRALEVYKNEASLIKEYHALTKKIECLRIKRYTLHNYIGQLILETELNMNDQKDANSIFSGYRNEQLSRWEALMGPFKDRFFVHNPQFIWNNSVRDTLYYWQDVKNNWSVLDYNLSSRCLQFLQGLVKTAEEQWRPDAPVLERPSLKETTRQDTADSLIDKLMSELPQRFVAFNEAEEDKKNEHEKSYEGIYVLEDSTDNMDDPDYQYKNIPESYEMKSKYLIDMINPQVNFQSEKGLDHVLLFTNERVHVKSFNIMDNGSTADKDARLVKDRIIVNLDHAQLLIASPVKDMPVYEDSIQNGYGQSQGHHWAAWAQPEQLWYYRDMRHFENFGRIANQLSGTIQLDRYNHLRIKSNKGNTSRKNPFEDQTNTMQLHFPQFELSLDSLQAHVLYYTVNNLMLGKDRLSRRKKERLDRFKDIMLAAERSDLAETVKQVAVLQHRARFLYKMHHCFIDQFAHLDAMGMREFNKNKKLLSEKLQDLCLVVEAIRSIQTFRRDIHLEETAHAMRFIFTSNTIIWKALMNDDPKSSLCQWTLTHTKFVFLSKVNGSTKNTIDIDRIHLKDTTASPVFTDVLSAHEDDSQPMDYARHKMLSGILDSLPPVGGIPIIQHLEINVLPLHLQIHTAFGSAMKDYFFPRMNHAGTNKETDPVSSSSEEEEEEVDKLSITKSTRSIDKTTINKREGSFTSFDSFTRRLKETVIGKQKIKQDELSIMKLRSSINRTFIYVRIPATKHCITLQGPSQSTFYNLRHFEFKQPKLEYRNKTWSLAEMMEEIQKQCVRAILRHSGALIKKKLLTGQKKQKLVSPVLFEDEHVDMPVIDFMHDFLDPSGNESVHQPSSRTSYPTTEAEEDETKSMYSIDPEEDNVGSQWIEKDLRNIDHGLLEVYMEQHKKRQVNDDQEKAKALFGDHYRSTNASCK